MLWEPPKRIPKLPQCLQGNTIIIRYKVFLLKMKDHNMCVVRIEVTWECNGYLIVRCIFGTYAARIKHQNFESYY